ncbi:MAG: class I SAM-dependent methyltransferase [Pseudomonadales bacterium]
MNEVTDTAMHSDESSSPNSSIAKLDLVKRKKLLRSNGLARKLVHSLLSRVQVGSITLTDSEGVQQFGLANTERVELQASITIENNETYAQVVRGGVLGAGESYILGHWHSPDLVALIRVFCANMNAMSAIDSHGGVRAVLSNLYQRISAKNTLQGSKKNIVAHYDLSNDFFEAFLDKSMMYSSAIFPHADASLEDAAEYKVKRICERLQLNENDHLLEIGTGWGALACYAATHYGCKVTTTTISDQQFARAQQRITEAGVGHLVTLLNQDYRTLTGCYDKLVSVEMIEAVGHEYYDEFFSSCNGLLKQDGLMLIQAITIADQRFNAAKNSVDFIKKYIFPGGCLPSNAVIATHIANDTDMMIVGLEDIGLHYAETLAHWRARFNSKIDTLQSYGFDERFRRMWEYYLCYCEGGFRERVISTVQVLAAKPARLEAPAIAS